MAGYLAALEESEEKPLNAEKEPKSAEVLNFETFLQKFRNRHDDFYGELEKPDPVAVNFSLAREIAGELRDYAEKQDIDLHGERWIDPGRFSPYTEQLLTTFNNLPQPRLYAQWQAKKRKQLVEALISQKSFLEAAKNWDTLPAEAQQRLILKVIHAHHNIYGRGMYTDPDNKAERRRLRYSFNFYAEPRPEGDDPHLTLASFTNGLNLFGFNTHKDTCFYNFANVMNITHHETTHMVQQELGQLFWKNEVSPSDAFYEACRFWHFMKHDRITYLPLIRPLYRGHPLEVDAFAQGHAFSDEIVAALKEKGIDIPDRIHVGSTAKAIYSPLMRYQKLLPAPSNDCKPT